jgi:hypothetical protein
MTTDVDYIEVAYRIDVVDDLLDSQLLVATQAYGDEVSSAAGDPDDPSKGHAVPLDVFGCTSMQPRKLIICLRFVIGRE